MFADESGATVFMGPFCLNHAVVLEDIVRWTIENRAGNPGIAADNVAQARLPHRPDGLVGTIELLGPSPRPGRDRTTYTRSPSSGVPDMATRSTGRRAGAEGRARGGRLTGSGPRDIRRRDPPGSRARSTSRPRGFARAKSDASAWAGPSTPTKCRPYGAGTRRGPHGVERIRESRGRSHRLPQVWVRHLLECRVLQAASRDARIPGHRAFPIEPRSVSLMWTTRSSAAPSTVPAVPRRTNSRSPTPVCPRSGTASWIPSANEARSAAHRWCARGWPPRVPGQAELRSPTLDRANLALLLSAQAHSRASIRAVPSNRAVLPHSG